jgi:hypothetical protein
MTGDRINALISFEGEFGDDERFPALGVMRSIGLHYNVDEIDRSYQTSCPDTLERKEVEAYIERLVVPGFVDRDNSGRYAITEAGIWVDSLSILHPTYFLVSTRL